MPTAILIVDDDPVQRRLLSAAVERLGYVPTSVAGGGEALTRLTAVDGDQFSLIILDLLMPDLDGMTVLQKLRDLDRAIPVIVQTAHGGIDTVVGAIAQGIVHRDGIRVGMSDRERNTAIGAGISQASPVGNHAAPTGKPRNFRDASGKLTASRLSPRYTAGSF